MDAECLSRSNSVQRAAEVRRKGKGGHRSGHDLFVCFTPRTSLTLPLHLSPARDGARSRAVPVHTASRFQKGSKKHSYEAQPDPSSPKVTCIGQVRVKQKRPIDEGSSSKRPFCRWPSCPRLRADFPCFRSHGKGGNCFFAKSLLLIQDHRKTQDTIVANSSSSCVRIENLNQALDLFHAVESIAKRDKEKQAFSDTQEEQLQPSIPPPNALLLTRYKLKSPSPGDLKRSTSAPSQCATEDRVTPETDYTFFKERKCLHFRNNSEPNPSTSVLKRSKSDCTGVVMHIRRLTEKESNKILPMVDRGLQEDVKSKLEENKKQDNGRLTRLSPRIQFHEAHESLESIFEEEKQEDERSVCLSPQEESQENQEGLESIFEEEKQEDERSVCLSPQEESEENQEGLESIFEGEKKQEYENLISSEIGSQEPQEPSKDGILEEGKEYPFPVTPVITDNCKALKVSVDIIPETWIQQDRSDLVPAEENTDNLSMFNMELDEHEDHESDAKDRTVCFSNAEHKSVLVPDAKDKSVIDNGYSSYEEKERACVDAETRDSEEKDDGSGNASQGIESKEEKGRKDNQLSQDVKEIGIGLIHQEEENLPDWESCSPVSAASPGAVFLLTYKVEALRLSVDAALETLSNVEGASHERLKVEGTPPLKDIKKMEFTGVMKERKGYSNSILQWKSRRSKTLKGPHAFQLQRCKSEPVRLAV